MTIFSKDVGLWSDIEDIRALREKLQKRLERRRPTLNPLYLPALGARIAELDHFLETREKIQVDETGRLHWVEPDEGDRHSDELNNAHPLRSQARNRHAADRSQTLLPGFAVTQQDQAERIQISSILDSQIPP